MSRTTRLSWRLSRLGLADATWDSAWESVARPEPELREKAERWDIDLPRLLVDLFENTYADRSERRRIGAYYTPSHVVEAILDRVPLHGTILDPACGAGAFLLAIVRRLGPEVLDRLHACDLNPAALDACAVVLESELGSGFAPRIRQWRATQAHVADFLRRPPAIPKPDLILGNPPYGRDKSPDLPTRFPVLTGEIDLYACFLLSAIETVSSKGTVALLVPDSWMTNEGTRGLRRYIATRGLRRIVDFGKPFPSARDTRVHAVIVGQGKDSWRRSDSASKSDSTSDHTIGFETPNPSTSPPDAASLICHVESLRDGAMRDMASTDGEKLLSSVDGGWFLYRTSAERQACRRIESAASRIGDRFEVIYGLRTGNNGACIVPDGDGPPLVGGEDLDAYDRTWRPRRLNSEPPENLRRSIERQMSRQQGRWRIGIQRIRTNSAVSWRRWVEAAPLNPDEIGLDSLTLIADREAGNESMTVSRDVSTGGLSPDLLALLGVLNSSILNRWYRLTYTDVNVKPAYITTLPLPPLSSELSQAVAKRLRRPGDWHLERVIDRLVAEAYGLSASEVETLERGFWGEVYDERKMPESDSHSGGRPAA